MTDDEERIRQLISHKNASWKNSDVDIDGQHFIECTFVNCRLIYHGGLLPMFTDCKIGEITLRLTGPAGNTISFLKGIHNEAEGTRLGEIANRIIEEITSSKDILDRSIFFDSDD